MNARFKELMNVSGFDIRHDGIVLTKNVNASEALETLLELVVRECAKSAIDLESIPDWYQDSVTMIPHHCSKNILQHFGVEE